jgi:hypothetical protein
VDVRVLAGSPNVRESLRRAIRELPARGDCCLDRRPAQLFLEAALAAASARVVYLVRTTLPPFGPESAIPSGETERFRQVDGVVGVSAYAASYVRRWSGVEAEALPISLFESGPYPELGRLDNEFVTMVNPCAVKGISIFLALADRMPAVRFAAVPTWGTNYR